MPNEIKSNSQYREYAGSVRLISLNAYTLERPREEIWDVKKISKHKQETNRNAPDYMLIDIDILQFIFIYFVTRSEEK